MANGFGMHFRGEAMTIDRQQFVQARVECHRALSLPYVPQPIRDQFKRAYDHAWVLLLIDEALTAKKRS
jgi:hypothetical protein